MNDKKFAKNLTNEFPTVLFFVHLNLVFIHKAWKKHQSIKLRKIKSSEVVKNTRARFTIYN